MSHAIDRHKLHLLHDTPYNYASPAELRREGRVFFIGGDLPVYRTLETMYESYCQEATELFHVTFGDAGAFERNLDMVRQIKRNFSIRLMGRIGYALSRQQVEQAYLAGLDILDLSHCDRAGQPADGPARDLVQEWFKGAVSIFTRWSVVSSIAVDCAASRDMRPVIHELLDHGVVPLPVFSGEATGWNPAETGDLLHFLAAQWRRHRVPLKPVLPLLRLTTPFEFKTSSGFLRETIDRIQDRSVMATSDIRRHLRTSGAIGSFESSGL